HPPGVGEVAGHDGVQEPKERRGNGQPASLGQGCVPGDGGVLDERARAAFLDTAAIAGAVVAHEGAVQEGERTQVVLVAEATAGAAAEVVGDRAPNERYVAIARVADASRRAVEGQVGTDERSLDAQVGGVLTNRVEPDTGALVHGAVAADRAEVDEHL